MGFVPGFLPWILYWALVGNVDFRLAVCVSLAVASGTQLVSRMRGQLWRSLEVGVVDLRTAHRSCKLLSAYAVASRALKALEARTIDDGHEKSKTPSQADVVQWQNISFPSSCQRSSITLLLDASH